MSARADYEPILTQLLELYPGYVRAGSIRLRDGWRGVAHLAHGWYLRCHRGVESILVLDRSGFAEEASPLRRSVIEHGIALRWLGG